MSKKNSELDYTKYDIDKEYVDGEKYGISELVRILDPEYKEDKRLADSLVYDKLAKTIIPHLKELFHIDTDKFRDNEDEKVRFYYFQFLKELYRVEYNSDNNDNLHGVLKGMSAKYIKDKYPPKSSTELDKLVDILIQEIKKNTSKKGSFAPYSYDYIKNNIIEMESQWHDRIMVFYDMVYNGKGNGGGEDYSADWNLDKVKKLLDLLYERVSKLEGNGWIDKSHNIFITFYISSLCNEYIRNSIALREYLNEKNNNNNRRHESVFLNSYYLNIRISRLSLNQEEQCKRLTDLIDQIRTEKMLSYSNGHRTLIEIVCLILGEKIENLPMGIQLTNKQCNDLLFASKPEHTDKILAQWKSNKTMDCEKYLFPVFVSIIQMLYNLRSDKEMRKFSIPGNPKKSLNQIFSKKNAKTFKIVSPYLLEIVEDNLLWNSQKMELFPRCGKLWKHY